MERRGRSSTSSDSGVAMSIVELSSPPKLLALSQKPWLRSG